MNFLSKLLKWGFQQNTWIFFHIYAGAIGAKIGEYIGFSDLKTLAIIFICAFGWEVVEFFWDGGVKGMINIYGSLERWAYDSLGDVAGAMLSAIIVVI